jgi:murein L,D-transpeptidase YafK
MDSNFYPLADFYRQKGIDTLEKRLDQTLTTKEFWREKVGDTNVTFGWYEKPLDIVACKKSNKRLTLYHFDGKNYSVKLKIPIVIGRRNGNKQRQGDLKTPVGIYRILEKKLDVDPFYGPLAFVTNYPNPLDKTLGKNGNGIWLHGFPPNCPDKNSTKGCIASPNRELLSLEKNLPDYKNSLLMITQDIMPQVSNSDVINLLSFIYSWRYDWKYNRLNEYLAHYSTNLISSIGDFESFKRHKTYIFSKQQKKEILFYDIQLTPYPNTLGKKIWRVNMKERYISNSYKFNGTKLLYILQEGDKFEIWREL